MTNNSQNVRRLPQPEPSTLSVTLNRAHTVYRAGYRVRVTKLAFTAAVSAFWLIMFGAGLAALLIWGGPEWAITLVAFFVGQQFIGLTHSLCMLAAGDVST